MAFFKFTPSLLDEDALEEISVGGDNLVRDCVESIRNSARNKSTRQILLLGPKGIGKSHVMSRIFHRLYKSGQVTAARLGDEEYSVFSLDDLCRRILDALHCPYRDGGDATEQCRRKLSELKKDGKPVVLFADNLHMIFEQVSPDLARLRGIIQSDQSLSIVGSALAHFDSISSPDEPFYRFFDIRRVSGLSEGQMLDLIKRRLTLAKRPHLAEPLEGQAGRMAGIRLLIGGNPRLAHMLADTILQKNSPEDLEQGLLSMLDQLTPLYQARMEAMSPEQRRLFDAIALSEGPISPTEIAKLLPASKPASIVTQLRRLQRDGLVENVKFYSRRGTRYQITERLYRIWREMRTGGGAAGVRFFIELVKLWYDQKSLKGKLTNVCGEFDKLYPHSGEEDSFETKMTCCDLSAIHDVNLVSLYAEAVLHAQKGQFEDVRQKVQKMRDYNDREKNTILKKCGSVLISLAELGLHADSASRGYERGLDSILIKAEKLAKQKIRIPKRVRELQMIHTTYKEIAALLISANYHEDAVHFNDMAHGCLKGNFCAVVFSQRANLTAAQKRYDESLELADAILAREPLNAEALVTKISNLTALGRRDLAVEAGRRLLALDVQYFPEASRPFIEFRLEHELLALTEQHGGSLRGLGPDRLSRCLRRYVEVLVGTLLEAIAEGKADDRRFAASALSSIRHMTTPEDAVWGCARAVFIGTWGPDVLREMFSILSNVFGADRLEGLAPLTCALEYLDGMDAGVLERLHPEARHLTIYIIQKLLPGIPIDKEALESVSFG